MGFRETTNYYGGCEASPQLTPLVDKMIGTAFPAVKTVADNIATILWIADNMEAIVTLAKTQADQIAALQQQVDELNSLVIPKNPTIIAPPLSVSGSVGDGDTGWL